MRRLSLIVIAAACATRNSPATQPTPKLFDAAKSDAQAIALVDQAFEACGGASWAKAKQIVWTKGIVVDGELKDTVKHSWDRWNGRHNMLRVDRSGGQGVIMHDLFDTKAVGLVTPFGKKVPGRASGDDTQRMVTDANNRFPVDSYDLTMCFKLKDPGVHLKYDGARAQLDGGGSSQPADQKFDAVMVTFDQGVGPSSGDRYRVVFDRATHLIARVEKQAQGKTGDEGWSAFDWSEYQDVKGLKIATRREEVGSVKPDSKPGAVTIPDFWKVLFPTIADLPSPGDYILINGVEVDSEPDDTLYEPDVAGSTLQ
jgi:hypothetical protein